MALSAKASAEEKDNFLPDDGYQPPGWLRYSRTVYFDGYTPPVRPHLKDFDIRRLVQSVLDVGGDTLHYQPIGYWLTIRGGKYFLDDPFVLDSHDSGDRDHKITHQAYPDTRQIDPGERINSMAQWQKLGYDEHSLFADPLFVDAAHDDYS